MKFLEYILLNTSSVAIGVVGTFLIALTIALIQYFGFQSIYAVFVLIAVGISLLLVLKSVWNYFKLRRQEKEHEKNY